MAPVATDCHFLITSMGSSLLQKWVVPVAVNCRSVITPMALSHSQFVSGFRCSGLAFPHHVNGVVSFAGNKVVPVAVDVLAHVTHHGNRCNTSTVGLDTRALRAVLPLLTQRSTAHSATLDGNADVRFAFKSRTGDLKH